MTTQFAIDYLLDDCQDCPENKDGECMTQSHCFEVKQMAIKALRRDEKSAEFRKRFQEVMMKENMFSINSRDFDDYFFDTAESEDKE